MKPCRVAASSLQDAIKKVFYLLDGYYADVKGTRVTVYYMSSKDSYRHRSTWRFIPVGGGYNVSFIKDKALVRKIPT